jgi:GxxExxY protein
MIENKIIVEAKTVEALNDIHKAQLLTYLKLTGIKVGLLINFNVISLKTGLKRIINDPDNKPNFLK